MSYRPDKQKLTHTQIHTHTDTGDDNTRRPKGPRVKNPWGSPGSVWPTVCIANILLEKFVTIITVAWFQVCWLKCTYHTQLEIGGVVILNRTTLFHTRSIPGCSLTLASISSSTGHTANTMSADALATLEARASAVMFLIPKPEYFFSSIKKAKITASFSRGQWVNAMWPIGLWGDSELNIKTPSEQ